MNLLQIHKEHYGEVTSRIPIWLFNISLIIGSLFLIAGLTFRESETIITIGFFYTIIAFTINVIAFVALMALSFVFTTHSNAIRLNTLVLLLNIPIAILYLSLIISGISFTE